MPDAHGALGSLSPYAIRTGGDGGVIISEAAAQRRRSLMGTGMNIGYSLGIGTSDSDDSDDSDDMEGSGSFNVSGRSPSGVGRGA